MSDLYTALTQNVGLSPISALAWIYGPKDLPASRIPSSFMDERRARVRAKLVGLASAVTTTMVEMVAERGRGGDAQGDGQQARR